MCDMEMSRYHCDATRAGREWSFHDVADRPSCLLRFGLSTELARRQGRCADDVGTMLSGIDALSLIWSNLPGWRVLGRFVRLPGVHKLAEVFYDLCLAPSIWRSNQLRRAREATDAEATR